jgi:pimeloyl-ACP methyl ester carboxylesterase
MLIPPMGHDATFYYPLRDALGERCEVLLPDYPDDAELIGVPHQALLDVLARFFMARLQAAMAVAAASSATADALNDAQNGRRCVVLGGVSLGATLSIRINHLMANEPTGRVPDKLLLMATGGLKVSRARKGMIETAMAQQSVLQFLRQSLAIDGDTFEQASFQHQFCALTPAVKEYWQHYAQTLWQFGNHPVKAENFLTMVRAALEVDYEDHIASESGNYVLLWSAKDRIFSMRMYKKLVALATQATFILMEDIGHYAPLEDPQRIAQIIVSCVES